MNNSYTHLRRLYAQAKVEALASEKVRARGGVWGSVGHGVLWDTVTEYHVVPGTSCPTEHRVPLNNPRIPPVTPLYVKATLALRLEAAEEAAARLTAGARQGQRRCKLTTSG